MIKNQSDIEKAAEAQKRYVESYVLTENRKPFFAPRDGVCYCCGENIYGEGGITVQRAETSLVTGCPHCHKSFCS